MRRIDKGMIQATAGPLAIFWACAGFAQVATTESPSAVGPRESASQSNSSGRTAQAATKDSLQEVIVTAQKRTENLQAVPISVTALTSDMLQSLGARDFVDYAQMVPGVSFASGGPGLNRIAIRGVSSSGGSSATVGFYMDDTPISDVRYNADPELTDLNRIEILRGPQGTLYGSGSMGGTIKLITNQPNLNEWSGSATGTLSDTTNGGVNGEAAAVLNAPLSRDVAALRVSAFWRRTDGWIDRVEPILTNPMEVNPNSPVQRGVNVFESYGFRAAIAVHPTDNLTVTPSVFYQRVTLSNPNTVDIPPANASDQVQVRISPEPEVDSLTLFNLAIHYTPGPIDLVSTTSVYKRVQTAVEDASRFIYYVFEPQQTYLKATTDTERRENDSFIQELRLQSNTEGSLHWLVGGFYSKIKVPFNVFQPAPGFNEAFGFDFPPPDDLIYGEDRRVDTREIAGFGQLDYKVTTRLTATAGVRVSSDKQDFTDTVTGFFGSNTTTVGTSSETSVNPKYELSYQLTPEALTYLTAARGFRLGGPISPPPVPLCSADLEAIGLSAPPTQYNSDHLWNYELGAKTSWFDNRLVVNAAAYYIKWDDIQQTISLKTCGYNFIGNAGTAKSKGGEVELRATPAAGLLFSVGASYTDAAITDPAAGTGIQPGQSVLETPRWNFAGTVEYRRTLGPALEGYVHFDSMYTSEAFTYFVTTDPAYRRSPYSLSNFRLGIDRKPWNVALFVRNVFNRFAILQYPTPLTADAPYYRRASVEQPRTIGVTAILTF